MHGKYRSHLTVGLLVTFLLLANLGPVLILDTMFQYSDVVYSKSVNQSTLLTYTPHTPITINGDQNFSETALVEGWVGDGSIESPFEINGLEIDRAGGIGHCINISNTRVNFTIRFCNFTGASVGIGSGIYLNNVSFGTLSNNTCYSNRYGIYLIDSSFDTVENNTCTSNVHGIHMYNSDFNTVSDNDCTGNSNYGILQYYCDSNTISRNVCNNNGIDGIHAEEAVSNNIFRNTCNGNGQDGINVIYHPRGNNLSNNTCNANNYYGIIFDNDHNNIIPAIVANNTCRNNEYGIQFMGVFTDIVNNVLADNLIYGFELSCGESSLEYNIIERSDICFYAFSMGYCTVSFNKIKETRCGFWLESCDENSISHNSITESEEYGIILYSGSRNNIFLNDIVVDLDVYEPLWWTGIHLDSNVGDTNVTLNRLERGVGYYIDSETISDNDVGLSNIIDRNFYDDYEGYDNNEDGIGDTPYDIPGNAANIDANPLVYSPFAPKWAEPPTDQVLDYWNQPFYYDLNATAPSPISWQVNDTSQFEIDITGVIQSIIDLPVDEYGLRVTVMNIYGISISGVFQLTIQEITPPQWIVGPADVVLDFGMGLDYGLIATDQSGIITWIINDTINFNLSVTQLNVTGYENGWHLLHITNATILPTGIYTLNVSVIDPYGNRLFGIFAITILPQYDSTQPIWIVPPLNETLETGRSFIQRLGAWDESGIHHWWLNDSTYFTIDEDGVVRNVTSLEAGIYPLEVRAYDPFDNYCSAVFVITVLEPTPTTSTSSTSTPITTTDGISQNGFDPLIILAIVGSTAFTIIAVAVLVLYKKRS